MCRKYLSLLYRTNSLSYMYQTCLESFMRASPVLNKYACKKQCITFDFWAEKRMMILDNLGVAQVTTETFVLTIIIFEKKNIFVCIFAKSWVKTANHA